MPLTPFGRVGQACEHEVDDVAAEIVVAGGDEDLGAGDRDSCRRRSGSARVASRPRSVPAEASVSAMAPVHSPETIFGR